MPISKLSESMSAILHLATDPGNHDPGVLDQQDWRYAQGIVRGKNAYRYYLQISYPPGKRSPQQGSLTRCRAGMQWHNWKASQEAAEPASCCLPRKDGEDFMLLSGSKYSLGQRSSFIQYSSELSFLLISTAVFSSIISWIGDRKEDIRSRFERRRKGRIVFVFLRSFSLSF